MGEAPQSIRLIQTAADVDRIEVPDPSKVAYLTQTTLSVDDMAQIIERLRQRFPQIVGPPRDDICYATQNRQEAVRVLAGEVDMVLVVGSQNSSNSQRLAELARACGVAAHLIDGPADIDLGWFSGDETVMITAGAQRPRRRWCRSASSCCGSGSARWLKRASSARNNCVLPCPNRCGRSHEDQRPGILSGCRRANRIGRAGPFAAGADDDRRRDWRAGANRGSLGARANWPARRDALLAVLAGRSVYDIEELHTLESLAPPPLRSAVEMAVWDLLGRALRQPLCNLLGGYYRRRVPVSVRLPGRRADMAAQVSRELAEQGFHTQTLASSGRPEEDIKAMSAIREMVGDRIELRFDGMGRYDLETARDLCAGLEFQNLQFFLDPLNTRELHPVASLARQTSIPLAVWRAIRGPADVLAAVRCSAAPFLVVDLEQVGGIVPARACAAIAAAAGVVPFLGGRPSLGIATAAMLHLAAAIPAFSTGNDITPGQLRDTVLADRLEITDGMMAVPESHGLGVRSIGRRWSGIRWRKQVAGRLRLPFAGVVLAAR